MINGENENFRDLSESENAATLIDSHAQVTEKYRERNDKIETCVNAVLGKIWTDKEREEFISQGRIPISFNEVKNAQRTVLGLMINSKYAPTYSPRGPADQQKADNLRYLYSYIADECDFLSVDTDCLNLAMTTGYAYMETWVEVSPGNKPVINCQFLNPSMIMMDPASTDIGLRKDADFCDRVVWLSKQALELKYPDEDFSSLGKVQTNTYNKTSNAVDRTFENQTTKDGLFLVIERYYKVRKPAHYKFNDNYDKEFIDPDNLAEEKAKKTKIYHMPQETLWVAVACPAWSGVKYLENGEYHCDTSDPATGKVQFPIIEVPCETIPTGEATGIVEFMIEPSRYANSLRSHILQSARYNNGGGEFLHDDAFKDSTEAQRYKKQRNNPAASFSLKKGMRAADAAEPRPMPTGISGDTYKALEICANYLDRISSANSVLQGQDQGQGVSGILNAQRISQSYTQLQQLIFNFKKALKQRARLLLCYWTQYKYGFEGLTFQLKDKKPNEPDYVTPIQMVPEVDQFGNETGEVAYLNDPLDIEYSIAIEDSFSSPTMRSKIMSEISDMLQNQAVAADPVMMGILVMEYLKNSDIAQEVKDQLMQNNQYAQQQRATADSIENEKNASAAQGQDLSNMEKIQQMGQNMAQDVVSPNAAAEPQSIPGLPSAYMAPATLPT